MKSKLLLIIAFCLCFAGAKADERLLISENFQGWTAKSSSTTEATVVKTTNFTNETLTYKFCEIQVDPTGYQADRFNYTDASKTIVSIGYLMAAKTATPYIELSPLKSITRVEFIHGATGSSRGYKLEKSVNGGAWETVSNTYATQASGTLVSVNINGENVALRFTNLNATQNAYLFDLRIYGNYESTAPQVAITTNVSPAAAGSVIQSPSGDLLDQGTEVTLTAERNFGYTFSKWIDGSGAELSTANPFTLTVDEDMVVTAVFNEIKTYSLKVNVTGGANSYLVTASPEGKVISGTTYYEEGTTVKVAAASNKILTFTNWNDNTTNATKIFAINENTELTANYSAVDFIVGWDFYNDTPKSQRGGDYYSDSENQGMISMRKANGTTSTWLSKGTLTTGNEGRYSITNWQPFTANDNFYYEAAFSTLGFENVKISAAMYHAYNAFSIQNVEYSITGDNFTKIGTFNLAALKTWYDKEFDLPEAAWNVSKVYVRFIPDYTSAVTGSEANNDGTSITDIFVTGDAAGGLVEPLQLVSALPENGSTDVSATGSIVLTFNKRIVKGTGNATLNGEALDATFSGKIVVFKYAGLSYNSTYTFSVPEGFITDLNGNVFAGRNISFTTMERTPASPRLFDAIVAADGSGDYLTVSEAIAAAPENRISPYLIFIKEGTYKEHVLIPATKPYMYLIGQDVEKVIITDDQLSGGEQATTGKPALHVSEGATVVVQAANFFAENIAFENSWGIQKNDGPQALALYTNNDRVILSNCKLRSYQDTYLTSTKNITDRHYIKNCFIEGAVDFIYGSGDVFFDECTINIVRKSGGYIVAPSHKEGTAWGYVFMNNRITAPAPANQTSIWMGRPWQNSPMTSFINTTAEVTIPAAGWYYKMGAIPKIFADYNTMDANGNPLDLSNRIEDYQYDVKDGSGNVTSTVNGKAKKYLTPEEAAQYTIKNVLTGTDAWQPQSVTEKTDKPQIQALGSAVSWGNVDFAICYIVYQGGKVVGFTTENQYTVSLENSASDEINVQAVAESGALSELSNTLKLGIPSGLGNENLPKISYYTAGGYLHIQNIPADASVKVYSLLGQPLSAQNVSCGDKSLKIEQNSIVQIVSKQGTTTVKVMK